MQNAVARKAISEKIGLMGIGLTPSLNALRSTVLLGRMLSTRKRGGGAAGFRDFGRDLCWSASWGV